jgi:hypothetical protein
MAVRHPCQFVNVVVERLTPAFAMFLHITGMVHGSCHVSSRGVGAMGFFNIIITMCVGLVLLVGAGLTYKHRMAERQMEGQSHPLAGVVEPANAKGASARASLPKWDDKNYKGLVHSK